MAESHKIMIIAGEVSGDMHAAGLVRSMRGLMPSASFFGIGGETMRSEGVRLLYHTDQMAVMGFSEVARRIFFFKHVFHEMVKIARTERPTAVILVDYPGFNLRFAKAAANAGLKVIYYICPQVWAWRKSRIQDMAESVSRLITIFPFEKEHFENTGLRVDFAGHPLVDESARALAEPEEDLDWKGDRRLALLPGSRPHEIKRILPVMWKAAGIIARRNPETACIVASPSLSEAAMAESIISKTPAGPGNWSVVASKTRQVLRQAKAAMVASGTATIEAALVKCPMSVVYRTAWPTYMLGKALVKVPHIGMVNIVANKRICPEFIQSQARPDRLAEVMNPLLSDTKERREMVADLERVKSLLGEGGASARAAELAVEEIRRR